MISFNDFVNQAIEKGDSEEDMLFAARLRFPRNTIQRSGGLKHLREMYRDRTAKLLALQGKMTEKREE